MPQLSTEQNWSVLTEREGWRNLASLAVTEMLANHRRLRAHAYGSGQTELSSSIMPTPGISMAFQRSQWIEERYSTSVWFLYQQTSNRPQSSKLISWHDTTAGIHTTLVHHFTQSCQNTTLKCLLIWKGYFSTQFHPKEKHGFILIEVCCSFPRVGQHTVLIRSGSAVEERYQFGSCVHCYNNEDFHLWEIVWCNRSLSCWGLNSSR